MRSLGWAGSKMLTALVDDDAVLGEALSNATGIGRVRCEIRGDGSREVDGRVSVRR